MHSTGTSIFYLSFTTLIRSQTYYNTPDGDPLGEASDLDIWFTIHEPLNDRMNASMCTGSGYIARRKAIEDIGGWPQVDVGEDFMCSSALSDCGWKVAFIPENLQVGLGPDSYLCHVKQRMRWVRVGVFQKLSFIDSVLGR